MDGHSEDLRSARTKRLLREALGELMQDKPFAKITVSELCGRAEVSRAAFYAHFHDKHALLDHALLSRQRELLAASEGEGPRDLLKRMLLVIREDRVFYRGLIINESDWRFAETVSTSISRFVECVRERGMPGAGGDAGMLDSADEGVDVDGSGGDAGGGAGAGINEQTSGGTDGSSGMGERESESDSDGDGDGGCISPSLSSMYCAGGLANLIFWWIRNDYPLSVNELADIQNELLEKSLGIVGNAGAFRSEKCVTSSSAELS